jgi:type I restriction enzyme S subunit
MITATTHIETKKQLVPELRFKEFEVDWNIENLGSVGSIVNGLTYSPDDINPEGVLVLRSSNVQNGMLYLEDNVYVIAEKFNPVFVDDILICVRNGSKRLIGKNTLITENVKGVAFGAFMAIYRSDFNRFLYYFFSSEQYYKEIHKNLGATINSINGSDLRKFKVGFPSLPEQQKIASFLSAVDEKIQQLTKKKELLEQYKKGVMQQLFSGQLRFKDENGNPYPDWEEKRLLEFCTFFSGGTPSSTNKKFYSGTIPFIGSGNIYDSEVFNFISEEALNSSSAKIVEEGDLLYALYGANSGEVAISQLEGAINQAILCIRTKESIEYLYYVLLGNKDNIVAKYLQGGQGNLSAQIIKKLKYKFPSIEEQQKIASYLSGIDTKIENVNQQITQTQTFKKGLLQQMFV